MLIKLYPSFIHRLWPGQAVPLPLHVCGRETCTCPGSLTLSRAPADRCDVTSGTPRSSRTLRHCLSKLSGSRHVPAADGNSIFCSPQNARYEEAGVNRLTTVLTTTVTVVTPSNTASTARTPAVMPGHGSRPLLAVWGS